AVRQVNRLSVYIGDLKKQYDASYDLLFQSSKLLAMDLHEFQKATAVFMESKAILRDVNEKPSIKVQPKELTVDEELELIKKELLK
ncbi:hypothetical protein ACQ4N7_28875, partial [Nodosilinea sp. AN01ver1]|uniref:hypothetical protein n=1 Tax=Nodosilinea sp. AN01ver1 TaxID=3423362 RepID=UPI003D32048E